MCTYRYAFHSSKMKWGLRIFKMGTQLPGDPVLPIQNLEFGTKLDKHARVKIWNLWAKYGLFLGQSIWELVVHCSQIEKELRIANARASLFFQWWWSQWEGGTALQRGRWRSLAAAWRGTPGSPRVKPSPTCGEGLASSCRGEMRLSWGTGCHPFQSPQ